MGRRNMIDAPLTFLNDNRDNRDSSFGFRFQAV